jgi:hypothetical protein
MNHSGSVLSHILEGSIHLAQDQHETEEVLSHVMNWSFDLTKKMIIRNARAIQANFVDFGVMTSYLAYGQHEIWAPMILVIFMMYFLMRFLISPDDKRQNEYVPKRYRKPSRLVNRIKAIWKWSGDLLMRTLGKSHAYRMLSTWWNSPGSKRRVRRLRTRCNSNQYGNRSHRVIRRRKRFRAYKKWEPYSSCSRYYDAEEDHFCDVNQFNRSDHPYYFDANLFENEWEAYEHEFADAMQFNHCRYKDDEMDVEFFDVDFDPGCDEDRESPIDFLEAMNADMSAREQREDHGYDSDSYWIAVDNCCSRCITNSLTDFVKPPTRVNVSVRGIGGSVTASLMGTVKWAIEDDDGVVHTFLIHNTYFNAASPYRLLSPQHMAQVVGDDFPKRRGTWCGTYGDAIELYWDQRQYQRTITLSIASNIGLFKSAPGYSRFHAFCNEIGNIEPSTLGENTFYCMPATEVSEDEATYLDPDGTIGNDDDDDSIVTRLGELPDRRHPDIPDEVFTPIEYTGVENVIPEDEDVQQSTPQAKLLAWHYRLGHVSFAKIRQMAARGDLPMDMATCPAPKCAACLYGKATRRAWRSEVSSEQINDSAGNVARGSRRRRSNDIGNPRIYRTDARIHHEKTVHSNNCVC